jgi:hypothetical protein
VDVPPAIAKCNVAQAVRLRNVKFLLESTIWTAEERSDVLRWLAENVCEHCGALLPESGRCFCWNDE